MAEGDTVHRTAARLQEALAGRSVRARTPNGRAARAAAGIDGKRLRAVEARGKNLLMHFEGEAVLHSHLGMNGSWRVYRPGERWRRSPSAAWLVVSTGDHEVVQWGGPTLRLLRRAELRRDPRIARLGPDILEPDFDTAGGARRLRLADHRCELGEALLDQRLIAGIGNIFKSEGCFAAGTDPWSPVGALSDQELREVVERVQDLMREALRAGRQPKRLYRRAGMPCPVCGEAIASRPQGDGGRMTYWCPACQQG